MKPGTLAARHPDLRRLEPRRRHRAVRRRRPAAAARRHRSPAPQHPPRRPQEELGRRRHADPHRPPRRRAARRRHGRRAARLRSPAVAARGAGARRRRRSARRRAADRRPRRGPPSSRRRCANTTCCASIRRLRPRARALTGVRGDENALLTSLVEVMTMRERAVPRPTFVLARGAYDAPTERVEPGTPAALGPFPKGAAGQPPRAGALADVAGASADGAGHRQSHWAQLFGRGLVATPADFGSQGRLPTHPALLDWLATHFVASGWDLKALQKQLVLSATYRQSSIADAAARGARPGQRVAVARPGVSAVGRTGARRRARRQRPARREDRRAERLPVSAGRACGRRSPRATRRPTRSARATTCIGAASTRCGSASSPPPSAISFDAAERLFCTVSRAAHQHAAAGAGAAERSAVRRGGAGARGAHDPRRRAATSAAGSRSASAR